VTTEAQFDVHIGFLDPFERNRRAVHIETVDELFDWSSRVVDGIRLSQNWRSKNSQSVNKFESSGNKSTSAAKLQFVRIPMQPKWECWVVFALC